MGTTTTRRTPTSTGCALTSPRPVTSREHRAGGAQISPCREDPDAWSIDLSHGTIAAANAIRAAAAACIDCPVLADCAATFARMPKARRPKHSVMAGRVVTTAGNLTDPERYIKGPLQHLRPDRD
jgi:hypothetical protein